MNTKTYNIITNRIDSLLIMKKPIYIAIDGNCGSGKTSLASRLKKEYDCEVVHMDDFYLQSYQRTKERYQETGGNVDYERFEKEVISNLKKQQPFQYQIFDCKTMKLGEVLNVSKKDVYIIEGSYSMHPYFTLEYDLKLFITINKDLQKQRIINRNGEDNYTIFVNRWIPYENTYFEQLHIKEKADLIINI